MTTTAYRPPTPGPGVGINGLPREHYSARACPGTDLGELVCSPGEGHANVTNNLDDVTCRECLAAEGVDQVAQAARLRARYQHGEAKP